MESLGRVTLAEMLSHAELPEALRIHITSTAIGIVP